MKKHRIITSLFSFAVTLAMLLSMIPTQAVAARDHADDNQNNEIGPVDPWVYIPRHTIPDAAALDLEGVSSADIIEVNVTATDRLTGETVTVPGATVELHVGNELRYSVVDEDGDGLVEISLAGLSFEERKIATISAGKVVSRGKAIDGTGRDDLFEHFPTDEDGEYYRYTLELRSETLDVNGNWLGAEIPTSHESNKVDIVFIIDVTGSMHDEINNVKTNIASFAENLLESGLDIRFSIIDYRDITNDEETRVNTIDGSHWMSDIDSVISTLASLEMGYGGDGPESVVDPLGMVASNEEMKWRSDAYRFAFVLTDADYKVDNNYGYTSLEGVTDKLAEMEIATSVICPATYQSLYSDLYETTGGIWADIYSVTFDAEMMELSDSIVKSVTREMTVHLSEPRLWVNLAVCYLANNKDSKSEPYKEAVKNVINEFSHRMAECTDGHVLVDKILLFTAANRTNFYNINHMASMADIRIETSVKDNGKLFSNVTIRSNAHCTGFYSANTHIASASYFSNLPSEKGIEGQKSFYRIQMSGTTQGWNLAFTNEDQVYEYSTTIMHEAGHYLLGFFDEYMDAYGNVWTPLNKPYYGEEGDVLFGGYGLMDNHHYGDIEISKSGIDYAYMGGDFSFASKELHTQQSYMNGGSCEDSLADLLTDPSFTSYYYGGIIRYSDYELGDYAAVYSKASIDRPGMVLIDRTATYPYAGLTEDDFLSPYPGKSAADIYSAHPFSGSAGVFGIDNSVSTNESVSDVAFADNGETVGITVSGDASVSVMKSDSEDFTDVLLTDGGAELAIGKGKLAEIRVAVTDGGAQLYNTYFIDRSPETDVGYLYTSADNTVMAYVTTDVLSSYLFVADNTDYINGEYYSVNQATRIICDNDAGFTGGEIYSVANYLAEIDYTSLVWFKYADGVWTALETDCTSDENLNLGARADLDGEGLYVLMAKDAPVGGVLPAENLDYVQSAERDALVTLVFDDNNTNSKYYNVYYSDTALTSKYADNVVVRTFPAEPGGWPMLTLNLLEGGRTVYAAIEIVAEDGSRSELVPIVLESGYADSDYDGIPDWYCDQYQLWGMEGEEKNIAESDDDGDGLTNLEEYLGGSDPTNPNDPVHTSNVPVESITTSVTKVYVELGGTASVYAIVTPENATNKEVIWNAPYPSIASVEVVDGVCIIHGNATGQAMIYAVTADGGFSAMVVVYVVSCVHDYDSVVTDPTCTEQGYTTYTCSECGHSYVGDYVTETGHTEEEIPAVDPTCEEPGLTAGVKCTVCGEVLVEQEEIDKLGHTGEEIPGKEPTCTETGLTDGEKCTVCGEILVEQEEIDELGHTVEAIPGKEPTCTETGLTDGEKCSVCGEILVEQEEIDELGHTVEVIPGKEPTCTETGLTDGEKCSVCGEILVEQEEIDKLGHTVEVIPGVEPTLRSSGLTEGEKCSVCGKILTEQKEIPALDKITGTCGDNLFWELTNQGTLTIYGDGPMYDYTALVEGEESENPAPWSDYNDMIVRIIIEPGATSIGDHAFDGCENLKEMDVPKSVTRMGEGVFCGCASLETVYFYGNRGQWNAVEIGGGNDELYEAEIIMMEVLLGDVNGDGKVNGTDTNLIFRHVSGTTELSGEQMKAADVNGDGKVNGTDTNLVFRFVSGVIDSLG